MRPYRSMLFLPGHRPSWIEKAIRSGADSVVLDLEDAVPDDLKAATRKTVANSIARARELRPGLGILVRVNGLATGLTGADLEVVMVPGLDAVFAPKVSDPVDAIRFDTLVDWFERRNGVSGVELVIPMETAAAVSQVESIARATPRVGAIVGSTAEHADVAREIGFEWTPGGLETLTHRSRVLLACRVADVHPMTGLWERINDLKGLRAFCDQGRQIGFRGQIAIHPSHVPVINEAFGPSSQDIAFYSGLVAAYEKAAADGTGAVVYQGRHIDKAHRDKAVEWLARADDIAEFGGGDDGQEG
jgi:citrate lyase subunit beta / citryl-CoA lyase